MKQEIFRGSGVAIVTPFKNNEVDYKTLGELIEFQIANGTQAIIVCGTTGESSTMTDEERRETIKYVVDKVHGRIKVIAGTGGNNTAYSIELSKYCEEIHVDGLLVVTPYYNKTTQKGLTEHYKIIAKNTNLPIILYNVPGRTGVDIQPDTYFELSKMKNIVATKEASGDISKVLKIRKLCKDNLGIYSGNDDQIVPILSLGGIGVISVLSNIMPKYTSEMIKKYLNGEVEKASNMQIEVETLIERLFKEVNPIPVKEALNILGFNPGIPRLPLIKCSYELKEEIKALLKLNLIKNNLESINNKKIQD